MASNMSDRPSFTEEEVLAFHAGPKPGKLEITPTKPMATQRDLSLAYSPGVAVPVRVIAANPDAAYDYTARGNLVAVISNGTAILGLGDLGALASKPVMEGKAVLFKRFADVDAIDLEVDTSDVDAFVNCVRYLGPSFGGINLEDIKAPDCFVIEERLRELMDIPVFHDDQHGTAVVTLAALRNAARLTGRTLGDLRAVISGAGAAGVAIAKFLLEAGLGDVAVADRKGIVSADRDDLTPVKRELASLTNKAGLSGSLEAALAGADVFIGVSGGTVPEPAVASMAEGAFVFAMANPNPEVHPDVAHKYAAVVATGRSDYPNQINNVLAFPGIFAGALQVRASRITEGMKIAAAEALAAVVGDDLAADYVIPSPFDERVAPAVTAAVAAAARVEGVARR
jgi:malate dehydrogenase (oxaloacetate-decarboxylating)